MFEPRFSKASDRLAGEADDLWQVHTDALARFAAGDDVILLSVGDPDLPTIDPIIEHAVTSLYRGRTHYSPGRGELALRTTVADVETQASGRVTVPDQVLIFPGATNAVYTALSCLLDEGDELIVCEPSYVGYEGIFNAIGCRITRVPGIPTAGFNIDVAAIKAAFNDTTRVLLLNTPGNPAGNLIAARDLRDLAAFCLERNVWLVCDEVYSMITFEQRHISARTAAERLDNVIVIDGLSKSHAMTGWRLGWAVADVPVIDKLLAFTSATVFGCSQFIQDAAAFAMHNDGEYIRTITTEYRARRDYACRRIDSIPGISADRPAAGMFLMANVASLADGDTFARRLLDEAGVSVLPGRSFGESCRGYVRISLTHQVPKLADAFDRIEAFASSW